MYRLILNTSGCQQFVAMGAEQRQAIRRALNEDAEKLLAEGDPADPQLRRLRREIDDVNRLFDEFERRARAEGEGFFIAINKCPTNRTGPAWDL